MPTIEFQITLDRRELASVLAGLRLLRWAAQPTEFHLLPWTLRNELAAIEVVYGAGEPLSDAEIRELARRLG